MAVGSLKSFEDSGVIATSSSNRMQPGRQLRAWKSMEELTVKGSPAHERDGWPSSLPSSPTCASACLQDALNMPSTAGKMESKTGHIVSVKDVQLQEISTQFLAAHERDGWSSSLPSSPTHASACLEGALNAPSGKMEAKTGHLVSVKDIELQEISTQFLGASERECGEELSFLRIDELQEIPHLSSLSDGARITELAPVKCQESQQVASTPHGTNDVDYPCQQEDGEAFTYMVEGSNEKNCAEAEQTLWMEQKIADCMQNEDAELQEISNDIDHPFQQEDAEAFTHMVEGSNEKNCAEGEQTLWMEQKVVDCMQNEDAELQEISTISTHGLGDNEECGNALSQEPCLQMFTTDKEMEEMEHASEDIELLSQANNIDVQESHSYVSTPPKKIDNAKHAAQTDATSMQSTHREVSLHEHLHQDHDGREEPSTRNFIMHRFLPAAQEIAAMECESLITFLANRNQADAVCPSPSRSQRPPIAHRIKTRAHQALKGSTATGPVHVMHEDDGMALSMRSCGFFCLGLKSALFRVHRCASASRKKNWASHLASHAKVSDRGSSSKNKGKTKAMEGLPDASRMYSPCRTSVKSHEVPRRHGMKCHANFSGVGHNSAKCNPLHQSQLGKLDEAGNIDKQVVSIGSPQSGLGGTASKMQEVTVMESTSTRSFTSACHEHVQSCPVHDLVNANMTESPRQIPRGGMETTNAWRDRDSDAKSCCEQDEVWQDGNSSENGESPFFDALSRLNSIKSTTSFYTIGSPMSQCESVGLQNESEMKEGSVFMDAASEFETPRASISENESVFYTRVEDEVYVSGEPSSLSQRFGKVLKLQTHEHRSVPSSSGSNHKYPHFEDKTMLQAGDWRVESIPRMHHESLNSKYPLSPGTVSPIFPAKCQSGGPLGWPLGISTYQSSRLETYPDLNHPEKRINKYMPGLHIPSPPLPPSPKGSWLDKAMMKTASNTSPLSTVQQKYKVASARKKLDFLVANENVGRRWEDVVKGSQVQTGHLRFSEELHQHHPLNHNEIQPLKL